MSQATTLPDDVVQAVSDAIDASRDQLVALAQDLIRIPSENPKLSGLASDGEARVQDRIAMQLQPLDCELDRWDALPGRPNLVAALRGSGGGRSLAVNGHIDVVPAVDPAEWERDPWGAEIADGKIWGRGALDMKGAVAAMIHTVTPLHQAGFRLKGDLFVESVIDEESGGSGTRATIERGYRPDFAIVCEPTAMRVTPVQGGLEWVRVSVRGRSAHAAGRFLQIHAGGQGDAVNALEKGAKILAAVAELEREWGVNKVHPRMPPGITTICPTVMAAGCGRGDDGLPLVMNAAATIPDYCAIEFDLKYLPDELADEVKAEFEDYIARVARTDAWMREHPPLIEWGVRGVSFPPVDTPLDHPAIQTLIGCIEQIAGAAQTESLFGVADISWYAEAGIPSTLFGPGEGEGAHSNNEYVSIDPLVTGSKVLALAILAWCGYERVS